VFVGDVAFLLHLLDDAIEAENLLIFADYLRSLFMEFGLEGLNHGQDSRVKRCHSAGRGRCKIECIKGEGGTVPRNTALVQTV
jgi:hypothetical protein